MSRESLIGNHIYPCWAQSTRAWEQKSSILLFSTHPKWHGLCREGETHAASLWRLNCVGNIIFQPQPHSARPHEVLFFKSNHYVFEKGLWAQ